MKSFLVAALCSLVALAAQTGTEYNECNRIEFDAEESRSGNLSLLVATKPTLGVVLRGLDFLIPESTVYCAVICRRGQEYRRIAEETRRSFSNYHHHGVVHFVPGSVPLVMGRKMGYFFSPVLLTIFKLFHSFLLTMMMIDFPFRCLLFIHSP